MRRTVKERGYTGRVLLDESGDTTGRGYGVFGTPTVYFVDRQGNLVGRLVGARDWESPAARKFVEQLLEMRSAEGQEIQVPYKGSVLAILHRVRGHLQSAMSYAGEETLAAARAKVLPDPLRFLIPLSPAARTESYER